MTIPLEDQRRFWNEWSKGRETALGEVSLDQAELTEAWMAGRSGLDVLDVGCGGGWLCKRLVRFGNVVGTDLADEVISRARARVPGTYPGFCVRGISSRGNEDGYAKQETHDCSSGSGPRAAA